MEKLPLVSVGMPVCNGEKYLDEAISSILNQTYKNIELIISDDNSKDNSASILKKWKKNDSRIRLFLQKTNSGYVSNFNKVLNEASGKYFCWAAQDDLHDKNFLIILMENLQKNPQATIAMCDYRNLKDKKTYKIYDAPTQKFTSKVKSLQYFLGKHNLSLFYGLYKTEALKKIGGYHADFRPYFGSSDFLMIFKALLKGELHFESRILFYKRDSGMYTNELENLAKKPFKLVSKRIFRYSLFPIHFVFDFCYGTYYLIQSDLKLFEKLQIFFNLTICTIRLFGNYLVKSSTGIRIVIRRIFKL